MKLNVHFDNASVYDFVSLKVNLGEKFTIEAEDFPNGTQWFFDNDPVLNIIPVENKAEIEALSEGNCKIIFLKGTAIVHSLDIEVIEPIKLNLQVKSIENK
jgi:hypothetical protein